MKMKIIFTFLNYNSCTAVRIVNKASEMKIGSPKEEPLLLLCRPARLLSTNEQYFVFYSSRLLLTASFVEIKNFHFSFFLKYRVRSLIPVGLKYPSALKHTKYLQRKNK